MPTHPGTATLEPRADPCEIAAGLAFAAELARAGARSRVGRIAARALGAPYVRHPSHGGARRSPPGCVI